jgi:hypothetical protein
MPSQLRGGGLEKRPLKGTVMDVNKLSPIVSEFETQEDAEAYDRWFRAKVEASLADTRPGVAHDEAMARIRRSLAKFAPK